MRHSAPDDDEHYWSDLRGGQQRPDEDDQPGRHEASQGGGYPDQLDNTRIDQRQGPPPMPGHARPVRRSDPPAPPPPTPTNLPADDNRPGPLDPYHPETYDLRGHPDLRYSADASHSERDEAAGYAGIRYESQPYRSAAAGGNITDTPLAGGPGDGSTGGPPHPGRYETTYPADPNPPAQYPPMSYRPGQYDEADDGARYDPEPTLEPPARGRRRERRAVGKAKVGKTLGAVYQSGWAQAGDSASENDMGAIPLVSIVGVAQPAPGGLDQTGLLDLGGPILAEPEEEEPSEGAVGVAKNSAIMALGTIMSRASGMLRTMILGAVLGTAAVANAYELANQLPQQVYELLMGGVLSSVIVPLLVKAQKNDPDKGEAFIQRLLTITTVLFTAMTAIIVAAAPLLTLLITNPETRIKQPDQTALTTQLAYLLLLEILFYALSAMFAAVLNSRGKFAPPAWIPVLNNLTVIVTAVIFLVVHGGFRPLDAKTITTAEVLILGIGTTMGIVLQAAALWIPLRKLGFRWKWRWDWRGTGLGEARQLAGWMLLYVLLSQIGVMAIQQAANSPSAYGPDLPSNAIYNKAYMLFMLPHAIAAVSVITALLPRMSKAATEGRMRSIADDLALGTRLSSTLLIPAAGILLFLGEPVGVVLFNYGQTTNGEVAGQLFAIAGVGLLPFAVSMMQTFVFYALRDAKTPAMINLVVIVIRVAGAFAAVQLMPPQYVLHALMVVNTISYLAGMLVGGILLRRRVGPLHMGQTLSNFARVAVATLPAVLVALGTSTLATQFLGDERLGSAVALLVGLSLGGAIYIGLAMVLRVKEIQEVLGAFTRRLKRR